jgi:hypothetical protein
MRSAALTLLAALDDRQRALADRPFADDARAGGWSTGRGAGLARPSPR